MTTIAEWPTCVSNHDSNIHTRAAFLYNLKPGLERFSVALYNNSFISFPKRIYITESNVTYPRFYKADQSELASGSYGAVVRYTLQVDPKFKEARFQEPDFIVVKGFLTAYDFETEKRIIYQLNKRAACSFSRVQAAWPEKPEEKFIFMENMQGSLNDWKHKLTIKQTLKIMREVVVALDCMKSQNLYYTDIKLQNILYKCAQNEYGIYIGDYGSVAIRKNVNVPVDQTDYGVATFPRFDQPTGDGYVERDEKNLAYGIFIVALSLASMFASNDAFINNLGYRPGRENKTTFLELTQFLDGKPNQIAKLNPNIPRPEIEKIEKMCVLLKKCLDRNVKLNDLKILIDEFEDKI